VRIAACHRIAELVAPAVFVTVANDRAPQGMKDAVSSIFQGFFMTRVTGCRRIRPVIRG
jgi:hypothetical protein